MYCLAFGIGLRSSEIQRAKFGDLHEDFDGNKLIRIHAPKSGGDFRIVLAIRRGGTRSFPLRYRTML